MMTGIGHLFETFIVAIVSYGLGKCSEAIPLLKRKNDNPKRVEQLEQLDELDNEHLRDLISSWRQEKDDLTEAYVEAMEAEDWDAVDTIVYRIDICEDHLWSIYEILRHRMEDM